MTSACNRAECTYLHVEIWQDALHLTTEISTMVWRVDTAWLSWPALEWHWLAVHSLHFDLQTLLHLVHGTQFLSWIQNTSHQQTVNTKYTHIKYSTNWILLQVFDVKKKYQDNTQHMPASKKKAKKKKPCFQQFIVGAKVLSYPGHLPS